LQGLRSQEVRDLNRDDLLLPEAQIRVSGKGNKPRLLPWPPKPSNYWITICGWSGPMHRRLLCLSPSKAAHAELG